MKKDQVDACRVKRSICLRCLPCSTPTWLSSIKVSFQCDVTLDASVGDEPEMEPPRLLDRVVLTSGLDSALDVELARSSQQRASRCNVSRIETSGQAGG